MDERKIMSQLNDFNRFLNRLFTAQYGFHGNLIDLLSAGKVDEAIKKLQDSRRVYQERMMEK